MTPAGTDSYGYVGPSETVWQVANAGLTTNSAIDAAGNRNAVKPDSVVGLTVADLHGSVAAELGAGGSSILSALRYDPYGLVADAYDSGGGFTNPWRYQGRLDLSPDVANPVYDFGARDYLPTAGVFASLDSYAGQALDPRSMNRYLYAEANPATLIDPDGHAGCSGSGKHAGSGKSCTNSADDSQPVDHNGDPYSHRLTCTLPSRHPTRTTRRLGSYRTVF